MASENDKINVGNKDDLYKLISNLMGFNAVCLPHYLTFESAPFHFQLSDILESDDFPLIEIIGFRSSAKTVFASLSYPLQCALLGKFKFIVIINDTSEQVKGNIQNIKYELEHNEAIKFLFPHIRVGQSWSEFNLLLSNGVRIIGRSRGQNIRGIRHREHRPDCIILDDPENLKQVKKKETRDSTEAWFNSEVVPAAQETNSKLIVIGNLLHNDGFMARLAKNPLFKVFRIPFYNEDGSVAWVAKYPTQESIDKQRKKVGETAWSREYLLKILPEEDQIIKETDIQTYPNKILTERDDKGFLKINIRDGGVGGDLAISEKAKADFTALVSGIKVIFTNPDTNKTEEHLLIKPNVMKKRIDFDSTIQEAIIIGDTMPVGTRFFIEDVGYQKAAIQTMEKKGLSVTPMQAITDKRARLQASAPFIKSGYVLFPETGCEDLKQSLINFGIEEHDDDVDALVYLILGMMGKPSTIVVGKLDKI